MKSKKTMKAKKSMKSGMKRRKAMKKSVIAKGKRGKNSVFRGTKVKTSGGLKKGDLMKNKNGKVVSKRSHAHGVKAYKRISKWTTACNKARKDLKIKGFCPIGGSTPRGKALLAKTRSYYKK